MRRQAGAGAKSGIRSLFGAMERKDADAGPTTADEPALSAAAGASGSADGLEEMLDGVEEDDDDDDAAAVSSAASRAAAASAASSAAPGTAAGRAAAFQVKIQAGRPGASAAGVSPAGRPSNRLASAFGKTAATGRVAPSKSRVAPSKAAAVVASRGGDLPALPSEGGGARETGGWWAGGTPAAAAAAASSSSAGPAAAAEPAAATAPLPEELPTFRATFPALRGAASSSPTEEDCLHVFWIDAYEDAQRNPGTIFLFGKVRVGDTGRLASCCVTVKGLERCAFVLPRETDARTGEPVSFTDVYDEIRTVMRSVTPSGKGQFAVKKVSRKYAFELADVPRGEADYLKLVYPARFPSVPIGMARGGRTYSRIFSSANPSLETFLLKRGIQGPCWLEIRGARAPAAPVSWCKYEVEVGNPKLVNPLGPSSPSLAAAGMDRVPPSPPLSVLSLSLKTVVEPRTQAHEIVMASALFHPGLQVDGPTTLDGSEIKHFTTLRAPSAGPSLPVDLRDVVSSNPRYGGGALASQPNERALLSFLLARIAALDPDVLMGHNISGFDLDVLLHRMSKYRLPQWSRIGRLRRSQMPKSRPGVQGRETFHGVTAAGRLVCDTYRAAQELVRQTSYGLTALAKDLLGEDRTGVDPVDVPRYFGTGQDAFWLAQHTENDAWLALRLAGHLQVLPLTKQLTNLAGNLWSRSLKGARAERIEYLLLHEFHRLKYVVPDKFDEERKRMADGGGARRSGGSGRKKAAYAGGLVLEPKVGLYDKYVLLLDFNSLYPSIIQEFNICFTTVERAETRAAAAASSSSAAGPPRAREGDDDEDDEDDAAAAGPAAEELPPLPSPSLPDGVLPRVIRKLVDRRRVVKGLLKKETDPLVRQQLDIKQKALKILANSMYGCLGFSNSRFYAKPLAALVTTQGREILQDTVDVAQEALGLEVIYGDTDSIMVHTGSTDYETVVSLANKVIKEVNKKYRKLEIDVDGVYARMLLLKKKKYAALMIDQPPRDGKPATFKKEMKGLDIVRRDWCPLAKKTGEAVLDLILGGHETDEAVASIHATLEQVAADVRDGKVPLEEFVITKGLNKAPKDYPDHKGQAHLQVAIRMLEAGKTVNVGDHIPYVITDGQDAPGEGGAAAASAGDDATPTKAASGGTGKGKRQASDRARHPSEIARAGLAVDTDWYMTQQLLPVVTRLCAPIEGTSPKQLAEALGLDAARFAAAFSASTLDLSSADVEYVPKSVLGDEERFQHARHLVGRCGRCSRVARIHGVLHADEALVASPDTACGLVCPHPGCLGLLLASAGDTAAGTSPYASWSAAVATKPAAVAVEESRIVGLPAAPAAQGRGQPHSTAEVDECRGALLNAVAHAARSAAAAYARGWHVCDDATCRLRTRNVSVGRGDGCPRSRCRGRLVAEMPHGVVHNQLEHLAVSLDPERALGRAQEALDADPSSADAANRVAAVTRMPRELTEALETGRQAAERVLAACAYHFVRPSVFAHVGKQSRKAERARARALDDEDDAIVVERF